MNDSLNNTFDAFAQFDDFVDVKPKNTDKKLLDKDIIKKIAEDSHFQSRQTHQQKQKTYNKTFSLFQEECHIIHQAIKFSFDDVHQEYSRPSSSDVIRAALHLFSEKSIDEQIAIIQKHRGRGRK